MIPTRAIFALLLAISTSLALAGEVVVDSGDIGTDILEDTTENSDSRSSEVAAPIEHLFGPPIAELVSNEPIVPLADAVAAAAGVAAAITVLDSPPRLYAWPGQQPSYLKEFRYPHPC